MPSLSAIESSVKPFLAPGEELEAAFPARAPSLWLPVAEYFLISVIGLVLKLTVFGGLPEAVIPIVGVGAFLQVRNYVVAATPTRILLLSGGALRSMQASGVVGEFPRTTVLRRGRSGPVVLGGRTLRVSGRFRKVVELAEFYRQERETGATT